MRNPLDLVGLRACLEGYVDLLNGCGKSQLNVNGTFSGFETRIKQERRLYNTAYVCTCFFLLVCGCHLIYSSSCCVAPTVKD